MAEFIPGAYATLNYAAGLTRRLNNDRYSVDLLWDKSDPEVMKMVGELKEFLHDLYRQTIAKGEIWKGLDPDDPNWMQKVPFPLKDGDFETYSLGEHVGEIRGEVDPHYAGRVYMKASPVYNLFNPESEPDAAEHPNRRIAARDDVSGKSPANPMDFYSGCQVQVKIWFSPYEHKGRRGFSPRLVTIIKKADGEHWSGGAINTDPFAGMDAPADGPFSGMGV